MSHLADHPFRRACARLYVGLENRRARLAEDGGGQHTEEGALIATLLAVGAGVATQADTIGQAIATAWTSAVGG